MAMVEGEEELAEHLTRDFAVVMEVHDELCGPTAAPAQHAAATPRLLLMLPVHHVRAPQGRRRAERVRQSQTGVEPTRKSFSIRFEFLYLAFSGVSSGFSVRFFFIVG